MSDSGVRLWYVLIVAFPGSEVRPVSVWKDLLAPTHFFRHLCTPLLGYSYEDEQWRPRSCL